MCWFSFFTSSAWCLSLQGMIDVSELMRGADYNPKMHNVDCLLLWKQIPFFQNSLQAALSRSVWTQLQSAILCLQAVLCWIQSDDFLSLWSTFSLFSGLWNLTDARRDPCSRLFFVPMSQKHVCGVMLCCWKLKLCFSLLFCDSAESWEHATLAALSGKKCYSMSGKTKSRTVTGRRVSRQTRSLNFLLPDGFSSEAFVAFCWKQRNGLEGRCLPSICWLSNDDLWLLH